MKATILAITICFSISISSAQVLVRAKPVSPRIKVIKLKKPSARHNWIDGHWKWNKKIQKYKWVAGKWFKPKNGQVWVTTG
jgi:hypothetical protein